MKKYKMAIGLVLVAASGLLAGLLFAPVKGRKLRKRIRKKSAMIAGNAMKLFSSSEPGKEDVEENSPSLNLSN